MTGKRLTILVWALNLVLCVSLLSYAALPQTVNPGSPADTDPVSQGASKIRDTRQYLIDILGIPNNVAVSGAAFVIATDGTTNTVRLGSTASMLPFSGLLRYASGVAAYFAGNPASDDQVLVSDSSTGGTWQTLPNCTDTSGQHLNYRTFSNLWSCGTSIPNASQAQMEAAASDAVSATPANTQYHPGVAKAWGDFGVGGGINGSYGVASITDVGTGQVRVTWTTNFSSVNYAPLVNNELASELMCYSDAGSVGMGSVLFRCKNAAGTDTDPTVWHVVAFGDLP